MFTLLSSRVRSTGNRLLLSRISPSQQITSFYNSSRSAVNKIELKTIIANNSALLIDVRQPEELLHEGYIKAPQFVNVPLPEVEEAMKMDEKTFEEVFGIEKPKWNDEIVVYCKAGVRSARAKSIMDSFGYKDIENYTGGYMDWVADN